MQAAMLEYFAAEKRESLLFIAIGVIAFAIGIMIWRGAGAFRGAAYPLIAVAVIQLIVGTTVWFRTDRQVATLSGQLASDPQTYRTEEVARMVRVMSSFQLYKIIEIALIVTAIVLVVIFRPPSLLLGVGLGLLVQASLMLPADIVAEHRGQIYLDAVSKLTSA
jgi:hypothetical protein